MIITLDLPDWVDERHIRIFAGIELAAIKLAHEDFWKIKDGRCQRCGKCCSNLKNHILPLIDGKCIHLIDEPGQPGKTRCNIALYQPRSCGNDPRPEVCEYITYNIVECE